MVRIIPIYNFRSQHVGRIEESTASCTASIMDQDMLLLALSSHCVKVYSLATNQSKLITTFPTVDLVHQIIHSDNGNYIATLESKLSRDGTTCSNFVRIYINWVMAGNQNQPMRARIAGRVTPSLNRSQSNLEMIELPLNEQPTNIACCQTTGNLLVVMGQEGLIHELKVETQQHTKHKFLDFEARPWSLNFTFPPNSVALVEDFIYIMDSTHFILIRLTNEFHDEIKHIAEVNKTQITDKTKNNVHFSNKNTRMNTIKNGEINHKQCRKTNIDFSKSINNEHLYIDWNELVINEVIELERLKTHNLVALETKNISLNLPSIEQSDLTQNLPFLDFPFINAPEMNITIVTTRSNESGWSENYSIKHLLRLKISKTIGIDSRNANDDYFTSVVMKPSYNRKKLTAMNSERSLFRSKIYNIFNGITCFISTNQEGYLYHFPSSSTIEISSNIDYCQCYSFTATVSHVALENTALHVFTEAGLESYTLRIPNYFPKILSNDYDRVEHINEIDSVSLISLRPFFGIKKMIQATKCVILLANDEDTWTFYSLTLPQPQDIYHDILDAANIHKSSSPITYKHLLNEAHTVLRLAKNMIYYTSNAAFFDNISETSISLLDNLYQESCILLADYYISLQTLLDWNISSVYYKHAGLKPYAALSRKDIDSTPGLVALLSETLLHIEAGPEADTLFQEHNIVEILLNADKNDLLQLILTSSVLREYTTDKFINILSKWQLNDMTRLALVLLYIQAGRQYQAEKILEPITNKFILEKILNNWSWLFDITSLRKGNVIPTFSDFTGILMRRKMMVFNTVLTKIVERNAVSLDQAIQIFLAYIPSRVGRDGQIAGQALQLFLETYLQYFYNNSSNNILTDIHSQNFAIQEGFKILVRSYLAKLTQPNSRKVDETYDDIENTVEILFENFRPDFLNYPLLYTKNERRKINNSLEGINIDDPEQKYNKNLIRLEIRKLQALLASKNLPPECFQEVKHFLDTHNVEGTFTFRILCANTTNEAIRLLASEYPQALLEFAKNKCTTDLEWKYFMQFLVKQMTHHHRNDEIFIIYNKLLKNSAIYMAQTLPMKTIQRIISSDISPTFQEYLDICSQIVHADYIKTMIVGTGQHLLSYYM